MLRVFIVLAFCVIASVPLVATYDTVYASQYASAFDQDPSAQEPEGRQMSSGTNGNSCASVNPTQQVRPPPRTPTPSSTRKSKTQVNFAMPTRQDFHNQFSNIDFFFDVANKNASGQRQAGGLRQDVTVNDLPALFGQRVSLALFSIEPCGINLPHTHPRATEMLFVIDAAKVQVAFVEENGGRVVVNQLHSGQATFFPQGLLHYELNLDCQPAKFVAILNHEDPGVLTATTRLFDVPPLALITSLAIDNNLAQQIRNGLSESPAGARAECLARCDRAAGNNNTKQAQSSSSDANQ